MLMNLTNLISLGAVPFFLLLDLVLLFLDLLLHLLLDLLLTLLLLPPRVHEAVPSFLLPLLIVVACWARLKRVPN